MRRFLLVLAVSFAGLVPALAAAPATYDTPKALMEAVYAPYLKTDFDWGSIDEAQFRSKALNALFEKDQKEANGEVGRIDFDPYVDGQDYELTSLTIGAPTITGDKATIEVKFKNMDMEEDMVFALVKEGGGWKIDDVSSKGGADPYDLLDIMKAPLVG
jgi:hypothetical protein